MCGDVYKSCIGPNLVHAQDLNRILGQVASTQVANECGDE